MSVVRQDEAKVEINQIQIKKLDEIDIRFSSRLKPKSIHENYWELFLGLASESSLALKVDKCILAYENE